MLFFSDHAVPVLSLSVLDTSPLAAKSVITPLLTGNFSNHNRERNQHQLHVRILEWNLLVGMTNSQHFMLYVSHFF